MSYSLCDPAVSWNADPVQRGDSEEGNGGVVWCKVRSAGEREKKLDRRTEAGKVPNLTTRR